MTSATRSTSSWQAGGDAGSGWCSSRRGVAGWAAPRRPTTSGRMGARGCRRNPFTDTGRARSARDAGVPRGRIKDKDANDCCNVALTVTVVGTAGQTLTRTSSCATARSLPHDRRVWTRPEPDRRHPYEFCRSDAMRDARDRAPAHARDAAPAAQSDPDAEADALAAGRPRRRRLPVGDRLLGRQRHGPPGRARSPRQRHRRRLRRRRSPARSPRSCGASSRSRAAARARR